jgi:hypothetical protein
MGAVTRPRGPLPNRVYWFRRFLLLGVAAILVIGVATLLRSSGGSGGDQATPVAAAPTEVISSATPSASTPAPRHAATNGKAHKKRKALPQPDGPCDDSDVVVTPVVPNAHVNQPIKVVLQLTTRKSKACTWRVDRHSVFVTISASDGPLWSSQQCPAVVPTQDVVPRKQKADKVKLWWNGKESDAGCTASTAWVFPGSHSISAVARGAVRPVQTQFVLGGAQRPTVTVKPTPTPSPKKSSPTQSPTQSPTATPTSGATGNKHH